MILTVKTLASPVELWFIVVVAVCCLALWIYMVTVFAPRRRTEATPEPDSRQADAATAAAEPTAELGPTAEPGPTGEPRPAAEPAMPATGPDYARSAPETAVTRDDMPRIPGPRTSSEDQMPAGRGAGRPAGSRTGATPMDTSSRAGGNADDPSVQWTPPKQRQSPTDQAVPATPDAPRQGRRPGGPRKPD
jgi:hypothetical protein